MKFYRCHPPRPSRKSGAGFSFAEYEMNIPASDRSSRSTAYLLFLTVAGNVNQGFDTATYAAILRPDKERVR
jgi:hypothetical protein